MGDPDKVVDAVEFSRRSFVKKLVATGFALPVISSFALNAGAAHASVPKGHDTDENIFLGNMTFGENLNCNVPHGHDNGGCEFGGPI
jgi:hypothetical protein